MRWMIASDIHGSAKWCRAMLDAFDREGADRLLLLGDLLYHGPRNDLPEEYAPKEVLALLNARRERLMCVRGNCDTEVDQMVLHFPIMADYAVFPAGQHCCMPPMATTSAKIVRPPVHRGFAAVRPHPCTQVRPSRGIHVPEPRFRIHSQGGERPRLYAVGERHFYLEGSGDGAPIAFGAPNKSHTQKAAGRSRRTLPAAYFCFLRRSPFPR